MNIKLPQPVHESYKRHRKELLWQITLPVVLTVVVIIVLMVIINIATFRDGGDVARWAAISTIWIVFPVMITGVIFLAVLGGLVFLLARLLNIAPTYTGQAQDFVRKIAGYARRGADMAVKPVIGLEGIKASINAFLGRK